MKVTHYQILSYRRDRNVGSFPPFPLPGAYLFSYRSSQRVVITSDYDCCEWTFSILDCETMEQCQRRDDEGRQCRLFADHLGRCRFVGSVISLLEGLEMRAQERARGEEDATIVDELLSVLAARANEMTKAELTRQLTVLWTTRRGDGPHARLSAIVAESLDDEWKRRESGG